MYYFSSNFDIDKIYFFPFRSGYHLRECHPFSIYIYFNHFLDMSVLHQTIDSLIKKNSKLTISVS